MSVDPQRAFGELRSVAHGQPDAARWDALCRAIDAYQAHPEQFTESALPYLKRALDTWPDALRVAPPDWLKHAIRGRPSPWLALVRVVRYSASVSDKGIRALLQSPWLDALDVLDLSDNRIKPDGALALIASPCVRTLRVLNLAHNQIGWQGARHRPVRAPDAARLAQPEPQPHRAARRRLFGAERRARPAPRAGRARLQLE